MLTPNEFKQLPEWAKIETAIREMITEHEANCISYAGDMNPKASTEAGICMGLRAVLELPVKLLTPEVDKKAKPEEDRLQGTRVFGTRQQAPIL